MGYDIGMRTLSLIWKSMRPKQWTKNLVVFAPVIFAHKASDAALLLIAAGAFTIFCVLASCTYLINDILDRKQDRTHPVKSRRPIISGELSPAAAIFAAAVMACAALVLSFLLNRPFGFAAAGYLALGLSYSLFLKHFVIIDVMTIAMGFVLRVVAGAAAVCVPASSWLFLCTILLALFLGFGKRRHELILLDDRATHHRAILREYSPYFLDQMMAVVTASTVVSYSLYAISPEVESKLGTPYLYLTIPFVLYGIFRYLYLIHQKDEGGSPSSILLNDKPLLLDIVLWAITVVVILYVGAR
jgi:4-hydroxybenzoate polyprenyltransferase